MVIPDDQLVPAGRPAERWSPGAGVVHVANEELAAHRPARLPSGVRGFEDMKLAAIAGYRAELEARLRAFPHSSKGDTT